MTLLGKIFTLLIFVVSLAFMLVSAMAYATHKNWKEVVMDPTSGLKVQAEDLMRSNNQLKQELQRRENEIQMERATRTEAIARLESMRANAEDEKNKLEQQYAQRLADKIKLDDELNVTNTRLTMLTTEVQDLREKNRQLREDRDVQFEQVVLLASKIHQFEGLKRQLEEERNQLALDYAEMKQAFDARGMSVFDPIDDVPPPVLGVVTTVSKQNPKWLEISLGADDGIRVGHILDVYKDNTYLGKVIVRHTAFNSAVAEILKDYQKGPIQEGANVTTKLG